LRPFSGWDGKVSLVPAKETVIKGPRGRHGFDVRRVWECPVCHRRGWTGGEVVARQCDCRASENPPQKTWMRLVEEKPIQKPPAQP
jgi:hypothetical protein